MGRLTWTNETRKLSELIEWPDNPRQIQSNQADRLNKSLAEFGQPETIAIGPDNEIYNGHQRLTTWIAEHGPDLQVSVRVASRNLTEHEKQKLTVYLHQGTTGEWDFEKLADWDVGDLTDWGFSLDELKVGGIEPVIPDDPGAQVDKAAELQEKWQVERGQIWQCGEHFVICGDCREIETWVRLLTTAKVDRVNGVFTSPPYAEQRKEQYGGVPADQYVEWWKVVQENVRTNLADDGSFFVNIKPHCEDGQRVLYVFDLVLAMVRQWEWRLVDELCWKHSGTPGKFTNRFKNQFEPVFHFSVGDYRCFPGAVTHYSDRAFERQGKGSVTQMAGLPGGAIPGINKMGGQAYPGNVIHANVDSHGGKGSGHSAIFPVALPDFFIRAYSSQADTWLDPFLGSGTTIVAAHQNKRRGIGIEMLEKYVSVTLERLSGMGLEPNLT